MKLSPYLSTCLAGSAFLLAGSFVLAQTASAARNMQPHAAASVQSAGRQAPSGNTPGTTAQSIAVDHTGGNGVRRADTGKSGDNPMYEGSGPSNLKPGSGSTAAEYKDPEDMTVRTRPVNNKEAGAAQPQSTPRKHIAGVKYEDRTAVTNSGGAAGQPAQGSAQRKSASITLTNDHGVPNARNSAHATESLAPSNNAKTGGNPLYEEGGKSGANPLYESGKLQKAGASGNTGPSAGTQTRKHLGNVKYQNRMIGGGNGAPGMAVNEQGSSRAPVRRRR